MDNDRITLVINKVLIFLFILIVWHIYAVHSAYFLIYDQEWLCVQASTQADKFPPCDVFVRKPIEETNERRH